MIRTHLASDGTLQIWRGPDDADYPVLGATVITTQIAVARDRAEQLAAIEERQRSYNRKLQAAVEADKKQRFIIAMMTARRRHE
ncbi:MAG: hypothetical protein RBS34_15425 [Desulfofustis sp.]|jgi:hypothetical protein|nr:hypothetical protein [Desulfofustis sp.]